MDTATQTQPKTKPSIHGMALKAMTDMEETLKLLRQQRSNINRLIQTVPNDKPSFLLRMSEGLEYAIRSCRTDLNSWTQKHFRGGEDWIDLPIEESGHKTYRNGHKRIVEHREDGRYNICPSDGCNHYGEKPIDEEEEWSFQPRHYEEYYSDDVLGMVSSCTAPDCNHCFSYVHVQNAGPCTPSDDEENLESELFDIAMDEFSCDNSTRVLAHMDGLEYARIKTEGMFDSMANAYMLASKFHDVNTGIPNI